MAMDADAAYTPRASVEQQQQQQTTWLPQSVPTLELGLTPAQLRERTGVWTVIPNGPAVQEAAASWVPDPKAMHVLKPTEPTQRWQHPREKLALAVRTYHSSPEEVHPTVLSWLREPESHHWTPEALYELLLCPLIAAMRQALLREPQRSAVWMLAHDIMTSPSTLGVLDRTSPHADAWDLLTSKVWSAKDWNSGMAMQWGSDMEDVLVENFMAWFKRHQPEAVFQEVGMFNFEGAPWAGCSPDGLLQWQDGAQATLEAKFPFWYAFDGMHPYAKKDSLRPPHYVAQMDGTNGLCQQYHPRFKPEGSFFIVGQQRHTWVTWVAFDRKNYLRLQEKARKWYFGHFLPVLAAAINKDILYPSIAVPRELSPRRAAAAASAVQRRYPTLFESAAAAAAEQEEHLESPGQDEYSMGRRLSSLLGGLQR